ncbi:MAG: MFS transporter [Tannerella sp.]|nr:MFS transporter [Tannerella sp.]
MKIFSKFPRTFWVANSIELFERWAWYGFYMLFANYLTGSSDGGGLEFSQAQKGLLMGVGTGILYFLPSLTGAIADRYGYRRMLAVSFIIYAAAFLLFPMVSSFNAVFATYIFLAVGAALFKPIISATIAKTTDDSTSSVGFGIFYMIVNVGAFIGPLITMLFKSAPSIIFYISAGIILLNFILLIFYREPQRIKTSTSSETLLKSFAQIFGNMAGIFKDVRFIVFLIIAAGFWTMYMQLFFTLPVFIEQWVDTGVLYRFFDTYMPVVSANYSHAPGVINAEFVTNFDAMFIIIFQIAISTLIMRIKLLHAMIAGFIVCSVGMALTLFSQNVIFTIVAIFIFAVGEMAASPKITEYIGRIAPPDRKALYMGYSFIPVFLGNIFAGFISGNVYQAMSDKKLLTQRFAAEKGLHLADELSSGEYFNQVAAQSGMTPQQLTDTLWTTFNPSQIWLVILSIGMLAAVSLFVFDRKMMKQ